MDKLRETLIAVMNARGLDAYKLEDLTGVPQPTTHRFIKGNHGSPRDATVKKWADGLSLSEAQLRGFEQIPGIDKGNVVSIVKTAQTGSIKLTHTLSSIPVFKWHDLREVDVAKGVIGSLREVERFSATSGVTAKTFAVYVVGNLMAPVFREGMLLTVEPTIQPNHEDFVVALDPLGEPVLKQYIKDGGEEYLITINQQNLVKPYQGHTLLGVVTASTSVFRQI